MRLKEDFKKNKTFVSILIVSVILTVVVSFVYFKKSIERERLETKREMEKIIWDSRQTPENLTEREDEITPQTLQRLEQSGINRYFLSEIKLINNLYTPVINICLTDKGISIYPRYVYETWSMLDYPDIEPEIGLIRYKLLPEDNDSFQPNETCYIKEIKTEKDWQEIEEKYDFRKTLFY